MSRRQRTSSVERLYEGMGRSDTQSAELKKWREYWHEAGVIRFAEEVLRSPDDCPPYPDWERLQETKYCEGCQCEHDKFNPKTGVPIHLILSEEQKQFLYDLTHGVDLALVSAGRGTGKTLGLAIWDTWLLCTHDGIEISSLAGSGKQSKLLQKYMNNWRYDVPEVKLCLPRSLRGIEPKIISNTRGEINFLPCSSPSVRGPHVAIVQIDEACEAESSSQEGAEAVDAIWYQIIGKKNTKIVLTSTTQWIFGKFHEYLTNPDKYGFKIYMWTVANHISGKPPEATFKDRDPDHWRPNVWWVTQKDIITLRKKANDSEWLCEILGRPSLASGQVFEKADMDLIVCDKCPECYPYRWDKDFKCPLITLFSLGDEGNPTRNILDKRGGFDYGDPNPCALSIGGRKRNLAFVIYSEEQRSLQPKEAEDWVVKKLDELGTDIFIPDPSIGSKSISKNLTDRGYSVYTIGEAEKMERVDILRRIIERHAIIIPKFFWKLITSLRQLAWDREGKIRKYNDHSFDSLQYMCVDWNDMTDEFEGVGTGNSVFDAIMEQRGISPEKEIDVTDKDIMKGIRIW